MTRRGKRCCTLPRQRHEQLRQPLRQALDVVDHCITSAENVTDVVIGLAVEVDAVAENTSTPAERMMMQIVGSFAEFERAMLRSRTRTGLDAARQQGRIGGRRAKLTSQQQKEVIDLVTSGRKTGADADSLFRVHPSTVVRLLAKHRHETATEA